MLVILLSGFALAVSLPALVMGCECLLAQLPLRRDRRAERGQRPALAVIIPAHNEQAGIRETVDAILPQLGRNDRLIVVADNCTDETATIARQLGATTLERNDAELRGKGYAVRFALQYLTADAPAVAVCIDADCQPLPNCIERITRAAYASGSPMQAAYTMQPPENAAPGSLISSFAVIVKNYVRPRGLQRLRMPCLITGSGIAYPWEALQAVPHPEAHIVEDMHYSVDLALAGFAPMPCMEAVVESQLPDAREAARTQRTRWEHGHLSVILSQGPRLLRGALRQRSPRLLALWLDLIVPPLSLLVCLIAAASATLLVASVLTGTWIPIAILTVSVSVALLGLASAWWRFGRRALPPTMLLQIPRYILRKLSIYTRFITAPEKSWVRTARDPATSPSGTVPNAPHFDVPHAPAEKTSAAE